MSHAASEIPPQEQDRQPGRQTEMVPQPETGEHTYMAAGKLRGKVALITGGDSGIGRSVAVMFAKEGADVAIVYLEEDEDAEITKDLVAKEEHQCLLLRGDVGDEAFCQQAVDETIRHYGQLNILVNNAAEQHSQENLEDITSEQLEKTFRTNLFSIFYLCKAALPHLHSGDAIINSTSVTAYRGSPHLIDYASTKGAIVSFTRSLSSSLAEKGIRVNAVAPGPIWTPLIPATFDEEKVATFGKKVPMGRPGQPEECGPSYVFLASDDASYMTGQVLHPNGGEIIGS